MIYNIIVKYITGEIEKYFGKFTVTADELIIYPYQHEEAKRIYIPKSSILLWEVEQEV